MMTESGPVAVTVDTNVVDTSITSTNHLVLLSHSIQVRSDGEYPYYEKSFLVPHETLRRELKFGLKALETFTPETQPWKAYCFHEWMSKFFVPIIHGHHTIEEQCFFPYYQKLGVNLPSKMADDHKTLMIALHHLEALTRQILDCVILGGESENKHKLNETLNEFKIAYHRFYDHMEEHLNEEEAYWPSEISKHGEAAYNKCEKELVAWGLKNEGETFQIMAVAIFYSMGTVINNVPHRSDDTFWAGPQSREQMLHALPYFPVRMLLLNGWNKKYQRFKTMITSIYGDEDKLHLQDKQQGGCTPGNACIIA